MGARRRGGGAKCGGAKGGEPKVPCFFPSPALFFNFFLSRGGGLLVELCPRVAAMDHPIVRLGFSFCEILAGTKKRNF